MRTLLISLFSASLWAQSSSATLQFAGTPIGAIITVNPNGFTPEIQGIEINGQVAGCAGVTLQAQITSASTSMSLTVPAGCTITPGMGIALGCAAAGGSCTSVSTIKAAGCSGSPLSCPVVQSQLGTTAGTYAAGTAVTILWGGDGNNFICNKVLVPYLVYLAQQGAATVNNPSQAGLASAAVAAQNTAMNTAAATIASTIAGAFSCAPTQ